ncbi:MAG: hypothetical protein IJY67_05225 [Paludibacteraceae bacterium]|nr:hypothetical protein [Paludibacteraceae bacterium]MBQ8721529.1 hypothetical protein [Paludibacteraceae bacterium]
MKTRQQTHILTLIIAMLIGIATTSVVSIFTTEYAKIVCQTIENSEPQEQQKPLFSQISALNIQITANNSKLPTVSTQSLAKRVSLFSTLNNQLQIANTIILNSLRESSCSNVLSYSHRPPLYYIFALHRMRD